MSEGRKGAIRGDMACLQHSGVHTRLLCPWPWWLPHHSLVLAACFRPVEAAVPGSAEEGVEDAGGSA